ncbi:uncharacterized protein LOC125653234 isoform X2 [Ostrea edulis]|uniref:uncharacterized protein LOC125653234 isoform X2 n=1 Tax=Ostrea edulis TaxID=37623 RepID=UPI0024AEACAF|nr:uncharacterized protein LOC125653234 isoform X2 [Ostrea edulis]
MSRRMCPFVKCQNNGTLIRETCQCNCSRNYFGFFCEKAYQKSLWPDGEYALPAAIYGCPETGDKGWTLSYINLTLPQSAQRQQWNKKDPTELMNIMGPYYFHAIQINFCLKTQSNVEDERNTLSTEWPSGQYCIYSFSKTCPKGFSNGSVIISGYRFTQQDIGDRIPGELGDNMTLLLRFCCKEDGDYKTPVKLPKHFPFILFQSQSADRCQEVNSMIVQQDYFFMNNENDTWQYEGALPLFNTTTLNGSVGVAYCYYEPYERRECYYDTDYGNSYNGRANVSVSGKTCLVWSDSEKSIYHNDKRTYHEFDDNYCRAYQRYTYKSGEPMCIVKLPNTIEKCNVPKCEEDKDLQEFGKFKPFRSVPHRGNYDPQYAVDGSVDALNHFVSNRPLMKPWYQIDLQEHVEVHAIIVFRVSTYFPYNMRHVGTYVSKNQWDFMNYGAVRCDDLRLPGYSMVFRYQCRRPVVGQYVTIRNFDFTQIGYDPGKYFMMEINEIIILGKTTTCGRPLGMASGNIYDYQIGATSADNGGVEGMPISSRGRLYHPDPGWCSTKKDKSPWFMIDLIVPTVIQGISIQGWISGKYSKYIRSFQVSYGISRRTMMFYKESPGVAKIFTIDITMPVTTPQTFLFHRDILTRYIKIHPTAKDGQLSCLKAEVIGCQKQLQRDIKCGSGTVDFGFEEMKRFSFWLPKEDNSAHTVQNISTIEGCRKFCIKNNCTALSFSTNSKHQECFLSFGDRYHPTRKASWVQTGAIYNYASHRLCYKDCVDIYPCTFSVNVTHKDETVIRSPGFPFSYGQGLNCTWTVHAGHLAFINLEFIFVHLAKSITEISLKELGIFDINPGRCIDRIIISDNSTSIEITAETQDAVMDSIVVSTGKTLSVTLESCFQMSINQLEKAFEIKVTKSDKPGCGMTSEGCTVTCRMQSAYIATDRYPAPYKAGESCIWNIEGTYGQYVELNVLSLDIINGDTACASSYIAVFDVDLNGREVLLGRFCKENKPYRTISSRWQNMRIEFRSGNQPIQGRGFLGMYTFVNFSQNYSYANHERCYNDWHKSNGSCYRMFTGNKGITWREANRNCIQQNGSLVSVSSKQELSFIHYLVTKDMNSTGDWEIYIGLQQIYSKTTGELKYIWSDGNPLTFTAWFRDATVANRQPNGVHNERCTSIKFYSIHSMEDWHDTACAYNKIPSYICEIDLEHVKETIIRTNWWSNGTIVPKNEKVRNILFHCGNTELISKLFVCDGKNDCSDGSDETNCTTVCTDTQFQCDSGDCISISLYCDFVPHCPDRSDESECIRRQCNSREWMCSSGQCIPANSWCDLKLDCVDGSDERDCESCSHGFECYDQTCIHPSKVCDGFIDCSGFFAEDESQNCENNVQRSCKDWWGLGQRDNGEYLVSLGLKGIPSAKVECRFEKGINHVTVQTVVHHSQEEMIYSSLLGVNVKLTYSAGKEQMSNLKYTNKCSQTLRVRCHYINYNTDVSWKGENGQWLRNSDGDPRKNCSCPFVNKCEEGKVKCNCNSTLGEWYGAETTEVREDSGVITDHSVLPIQKLSVQRPGENRFFKIDIGPLVCYDETDEVNRDFLCRTGKTVPMNQRCILDYDVYGNTLGCRDLSHLDECEAIACPAGYIKCPSSFCIPPRLICDGEKHCKDGADEMHCESCPGLYRCRNSRICLDPDNLCDNIPQCPELDDELLCNLTCPKECECDGFVGNCGGIQNKHIVRLSQEMKYLNLSESDFSDGLPSLQHLEQLVKLFVTNCGLRSIKSYSFAKLQNLLVLDLSNNRITNLFANAFAGLVSLKMLNLEGNGLLDEITDMAFLGLRTLPKLVLTNTRLQNIGQGTLVGLRNVRLLNLSANQIHFVADSALQNLSELTVLDLRKNRIEQFSHKIFYGLSKLKKLYTDAYTFCCLKPSSVDECLPNADEFSSCDDLMRNEVLSSFLWIIGFSSLLGNLGVFIFKVFFDSQTLKKGHGIFIMNLSVSDFLMGVYLIIIASADIHYRGRYAWNDIHWRHSITCQIAGILATISSETSVLLLCLITIDRLIAVKYPFGQFRFTRGKALFCTGIIWCVTILLAAIPLIPGEYFRGQFYSRSVVCLALPLTRDKPAGWEYSTAIFILLNFVLFTIIALGQCLIYREVSLSGSKVKSTRRNQDMVIARGLFLVVLSDFLCWFPIGIMGLLALNGYVISGEVYAWVAVFNLPINSALNPFLYSFANIRKRMEALSSKRKRVAHCQSAMTQTIRDLWENELFVVGKHAPVYATLSDYMRNHTLTVPEMKLVVLRLAEALKFLHEHDLILGRLERNLVHLDIVDGKITNVYLKTVPREAEEDEDIPDDIKLLGELTSNLLRNHQKCSSTVNTSP